jgi:hypothetical protein
MGVNMKSGTDSSLPPPAARFTVLAVRRGVSLGVLLSTHARDFELVLAAAAQSFEPGRGYSEREVNERLRAFLGGPGAMLGTDYVELRRWLVDFRVLSRDGYGRVYTAGTPAEKIAALITQLAGVDLGAVAHTAREDDAAKRAQRKELWQGSAAGEGKTP